MAVFACSKSRNGGGEIQVESEGRARGDWLDSCAERHGHLLPELAPLKFVVYRSGIQKVLKGFVYVCAAYQEYAAAAA
jgi:hypothetical protein